MINDDNKVKLEQACSKPGGCALSRLYDELLSQNGLLWMPSLIHAGTEIGLTKAECEGIMDGWDTYRYYRDHGLMDGWDTYRYYRDHGLFHENYYSSFREMPRTPQQDEYDAGFKLGRSLCERFGGRADP